MATGQDRGLTKLTGKMYEPMFRDFDRQLIGLLLRRDAFLDKVIAQEIPHLRADLKGKRLSDAANRYISQSLKRLGGDKAGVLLQVSIALRHQTADELRYVVEEHNLVRDAFLNRLIVLLRSSDMFLKALDLPTRIEWNRRDGTEDMPMSPLRAIEETLWDPFHYLRAACQTRHGCGLHLLQFPQQLVALSCYLDDEQVPGTQAYRERDEENRLLLLEGLADFEANLTPIKNQGA